MNDDALETLELLLLRATSSAKKAWCAIDVKGLEFLLREVEKLQKERKAHDDSLRATLSPQNPPRTTDGLADT